MIMPDNACPFCGSSSSSSHGASIHRVRCSKNPGRKVWSRAGVKNGGAPKKRPARFDGEPTSLCHDAPVRTGKPHENGNRYCTKCGDPCFWRANRYLPTTWSCKTPHCDAAAHWRAGYCKRCFEKRTKPRGEDVETEDDPGTL